MYGVSQNEQLTVFLCSLGLGFILGIIYDFLRGVRLSLSGGKSLVVIFDILYFLILSFITFIFILALNKGEVRLYIIFGEALGLLFYYFSFGIAAIKLTDKIILFLKKFYSLIFKIITFPFFVLKRLFRNVLVKIRKIFKKTQKKNEKIKKKHLQKLRIYVYNLFGILLANRNSSEKGEGSFGKEEK